MNKLLLLLLWLLPSAAFCQNDLSCYDEVKTVLDEYAIVRKGTEYRLVTTEGKVVIETAYDDMEIVRLQDGNYLVPVKKDDHWGILDNNGKPLTDMVFDIISINPWGTPRVTIGGNSYELRSTFRNNLAIVREVELYGLMDNNGLLRTPCKYSYIEPFEEGATTTFAEFISQVMVGIDLQTGEDFVKNKRIKE